MSSRRTMVSISLHDLFKISKYLFYLLKESNHVNASKEPGDRPTHRYLKAPARASHMHLVGDTKKEPMAGAGGGNTDHFGSKKQSFTRNRGISMLESVTSFHSEPYFLAFLS